MVPSGTSHVHEVSVNPDDVDVSWKSRDAADSSRQYEEDDSSETLLPSSSRRVPNRNEERARVDYRILSSRNKNRHRSRDRNEKKKLYSYLRVPARQPNLNKRVEGLRYPPRYIRPPPVRPRNRNQQARFQTQTWSPSIREPERPRVIYEPTAAPRKPIYSYPRDAMSIQDIIK